MAGLPSGLAVFLEFQAAWRRFKKNFSKALTGGIGFRIFRAQLGRNQGKVGVMGFCRLLESGSNSLAQAHVAQLAERVLCKDEVISSILIMGSRAQYN